MVPTSRRAAVILTLILLLGAGRATGQDWVGAHFYHDIYRHDRELIEALRAIGAGLMVATYGTGGLASLHDPPHGLP